MIVGVKDFVHSPLANGKRTGYKGGMNKWEYKVISNFSENALNILGDEGWELVALTLGFKEPQGNSVMAVLKRPQQPKQLSPEQQKQYAAGPVKYGQPEHEDD